MYACFGVTCHLRFQKNDQGLLLGTAVTQQWNRHQKSRHRKWRQKFSNWSCWALNPQTYNHKSGALPTDLSQHSYFIDTCLEQAVSSVSLCFRFSVCVCVCMCVCVCVYVCGVCVCDRPVEHANDLCANNRDHGLFITGSIWIGSSYTG